ncbi:MAG TPA: diguanylate cyclase [Turneriella sp.]|nr:diguanylate cyclase [Turneriella sp.]
MRVSSGIQSELDLINQVFANDDADEEEIIAAADILFKSGEKNIYARLLHVMCHLRLSPSDARKTWQSILKHRDILEEKLERHVGFRVAMLDYFVNESHELKNPKVIEIRVYAETARQAAVDELTGLFNRRFFDTAIERELKQAARRHRQFSLLILDIDNFKKINDTHGHTTGDAVISALGKLLKKLIRSEDTPCRIGGEEFAIIFPETAADGAMTVSEKIRREFSKLKIAATDLSLCGGLTTYPDDGTTVTELIDRADQMLYFAKYSGKNRVICYSQNKRRHIRYPLEWEIAITQKDQTSSKGKSLDVSIEGISFELDVKTEPGEKFNLWIDIDHNPVELPVEIVWVDNKAKSRKLRAGARFLALKARDLTTLKEHLPH